jgi:threonine dehydrogenase-like Zn-dependent dehydrogenase
MQDGRISPCVLGADVIIECTGAASVIARVIGNNTPGAIVCLAGLSSGAHHIHFDLSELNREMVLQNDVIFGSVNANRRHYDLAANALTQASPDWLRGLISRRLPLSEWRSAIQPQPGDIKVVIDFSL